MNRKWSFLFSNWIKFFSNIFLQMNNNNLQNPSSDLLCINNKNLDWSEMRIQNIFLFLFIYTTMIHCHTIGIPNPISKNSYDFSETVVYRLCILQDEDVSDSRVNFMVNRLTEELKDYNIKLEIPFKKNGQETIFLHMISYTMTLFIVPYQTNVTDWLLLLPEDLEIFFFHFLVR